MTCLQNMLQHIKKSLSNKVAVLYSMKLVNQDKSSVKSKIFKFSDLIFGLEKCEHKIFIGDCVISTLIFCINRIEGDIKYKA